MISKTSTVGKIASVQTGPFGSQLHNKDYVLVGTPIVTVEHLGQRKMSRQNLPLVSEADKDRLSKYTLQYGDLVFSRVGSVDRCSWVGEEEDGWLFSGRCLRVRPNNPSEIYHKYLYYFFCLESTKNHVRNVAVGATMPSINTQLLSEVPLTFPSINDQRKIGDLLSALDDRIEVNQAINHHLEQMAQTVFRHWFVENDDAKDWDIGRLDDLLVLQRGFDLPTPNRIPGKYPVIAASGPSGTHNEYKVKGPGVTTGRSGVIGQVYFVYEDFWPLNTSLWIKEFKLAKPAYAYYLLRTLDFAMFNAGSAVPTLNRNHVHNLKLLIPPSWLISRYEDFAMPLLEKIYANETESSSLANLRDSLLPKLMSGELSVVDVDAK